MARSWQNNVQFEHALSDTYSVGVGVRRGNNLPVVTNINLINPIGALADGNPVFSTAVNAGTRLDPATTSSTRRSRSASPPTAT